MKVLLASCVLAILIHSKIITTSPIVPVHSVSNPSSGAIESTRTLIQTSYMATPTPTSMSEEDVSMQITYTSPGSSSASTEKTPCTKSTADIVKESIGSSSSAKPTAQVLRGGGALGGSHPASHPIAHGSGSSSNSAMLKLNSGHLALLAVPAFLGLVNTIM